ncbi:M23 family metallopeptidase [Microbacterium phosphatis]|uniref:M23 family metallopeptidase n=1 Tax=Microbacterium phosphatis TaxID=3140248 RepID=UPI0031402354
MPRAHRVAIVRAMHVATAFTLLGLTVAATGAALPAPTPAHAEARTADAPSFTAETAMSLTHEQGEDEHGHGAPEVGLPTFEGYGLPARTERLAEDVREAAIQLPTSPYAATTPAELAEIRREERLALVAAARRAGLDVDLSRFAEHVDLTKAGLFAWPVAGGGHITDRFAARGGQHQGLDIAAAGGTPVGAAASGVVILSSESYFGYGVAVMILHADGLVTLYGHLTHGSRAVAEGDWVEMGDAIGLVGNTGHSFGNHLHFEVRVNGRAVNPEPYLGGSDTRPVIRPWEPVAGAPAPRPAAVPSAPRPAAVPSAGPTPTPPKPSAPAPATPKPTDTPSPTATPSPSPTPEPTPTTTPTATPTPKPTTTPTPTPKPTPTTTPKPTPTPTTTTAPKPTPTTTTAPPPAPAPTTPAPKPAPTQTTAPAPAPVETTEPAPSPTPEQTPSSSSSSTIVGGVVEAVDDVLGG